MRTPAVSAWARNLRTRASYGPRRGRSRAPSRARGAAWRRRRGSRRSAGWACFRRFFSHGRSLCGVVLRPARRAGAGGADSSASAADAAGVSAAVPATASSRACRVFGRGGRAASGVTRPPAPTTCSTTASAAAFFARAWSAIGARRVPVAAGRPRPPARRRLDDGFGGGLLRAPGARLLARRVRRRRGGLDHRHGGRLDDGFWRRPSCCAPGARLRRGLDPAALGDATATTSSPAQARPGWQAQPDLLRPLPAARFARLALPRARPPRPSTSDSFLRGLGLHRQRAFDERKSILLVAMSPARVAPFTRSDRRNCLPVRSP